VGIGFNFIGRKVGQEIKKFITLLFEARKDDNRNALLYTPAGDDSIPLDDERLILLRTDGNGRYIAAGVLTPSQGAKPGEKIFFGRDAKGKIVSKIKMLNDGLFSLDTDTETTGEAKGDYKRTIKGLTTILERKDRNYTNEANVNGTIKGSKELTIDGNYTLNVKGNFLLNITGNYTLNVKGAVVVKSNTSIEMLAPTINWN
jgi:hypothetical protein